MALFKSRRERELEVEVSDLYKERGRLKKEVEDLKIARKIADEDIKHMVRIKEEKMAVEQERKELERDRKKASEVETIRNEYRDKIERGLEEQIKNMRGMYDAILARLPDVNVALSGKVGKR